MGYRFLLKYESRDEVAVLGRGNGGIVEVRNAVAEYDETSPLYGFLKYRRRSVIIKYLPGDCSRIIQGKRPFNHPDMVLLGIDSPCHFIYLPY